MGHGRALAAEAATWPTPAARDWKSGAASEETLNRNARPLSEAVTTWPTPTTSMATLQDLEQARFAGDDPRRPAYANAWPTPTADLGTGYMSGSKSDTWRPSLAGAAAGLRPSRSGRPALATPTAGGFGSSSTPALNPRFVATLMGLPDSWLNVSTPCAPEAMASWLSRARLLLWRLVGDQP